MSNTGETFTTAVIVVAAGTATRFGGETPKQYLRLRGRTILNRALDRPSADHVVAVINADHRALYDELIHKRENMLPAVLGGENRQASVRAGLEALAQLDPAPDVVLIHDAARPDMPEDVFKRVASAALQTGGAFASLESTDSLHVIAAADNAVERSLERGQTRRAQTPQGFQFAPILNAHRQTDSSKGFTDDVSLALAAGLPVTAVEGALAGEKITFPEDLSGANSAAEHRNASEGAITDVRTGVGYDVHAFDEPPEDGSMAAVVLGGLNIPHERALAGHSDADVLLHTITDALLGAIGDGDIGEHFPPSEDRWKGAASDQFLIHARDLATAAGWSINHVDSTVICERPKLSAYKKPLRESVAKILDVEVGKVSVKATTSERLGFTGRQEGIACAATVTLVKRA